MFTGFRPGTTWSFYAGLGIDAGAMFSATEIADFLACHHLTTLERSAAGEIRKPFFADPGVDLLRTLGIRHEQAYLADLRARGLEVVEIPTEAAWNEASDRTVEAVRQGADAVTKPPS